MKVATDIFNEIQTQLNELEKNVYAGRQPPAGLMGDLRKNMDKYRRTALQTNYCEGCQIDADEIPSLGTHQAV